MNKRIDDLIRLMRCSVASIALGMNSYAIKDNQVSASSVYKDKPGEYGPQRARLNYKDWNGWAAKTNDVNQWLQISFGKKTVVTGVATQGYNPNINPNEWVTSYQLSFSDDGKTWTLYKDNGTIKTFVGNTNDSSVVKHNLKHPVSTRYIRILPKTWKTHISMRMEVYGCYD